MAREAPKFYTRQEVADMRGVHVRSIDKMIRKGHIKAVRLGTRKLGIPEEEVLNPPQFKRQTRGKAKIVTQQTERAARQESMQVVFGSLQARGLLSPDYALIFLPDVPNTIGRWDVVFRDRSIQHDFDKTGLCSRCDAGAQTNVARAGCIKEIPKDGA